MGLIADIPDARYDAIVIGRAGMDLYPDPPGTRTDEATRFVTDMGGSAAAITVDEAAAGLVERFAALSMDTTGCFETWDGRAHPL